MAAVYKEVRLVELKKKKTNRKVFISPLFLRLTLAFTLRPSPYLQITLPDCAYHELYLNTSVKEGNHTNVAYCYQIYFCSISKTVFFFLLHVASAFSPFILDQCLLDHNGFWTNCISITWGVLRKADPQPSHRCSKIKILSLGNRTCVLKSLITTLLHIVLLYPFMGIYLSIFFL